MSLIVSSLAKIYNIQPNARAIYDGPDACPGCIDVEISPCPLHYYAMKNLVNQYYWKSEEEEVSDDNDNSNSIDGNTRSSNRLYWEIDQENNDDEEYDEQEKEEIKIVHWLIDFRMAFLNHYGEDYALEHGVFLAQRASYLRQKDVSVVLAGKATEEDDHLPIHQNETLMFQYELEPIGSDLPLRNLNVPCVYRQFDNDKAHGSTFLIIFDDGHYFVLGDPRHMPIDQHYNTFSYRLDDIDEKDGSYHYKSYRHFLQDIETTINQSILVHQTFKQEIRNQKEMYDTEMDKKDLKLNMKNKRTIQNKDESV